MAVPAQCWDWPGFKDCQLTALTKAQAFCSSLYKSGTSEYSDCYSKVSAENIQADCVIGLGCGLTEIVASSVTTLAMKNLPWGTYNATTKLVQTDANKVLPGMGLASLTADGKLGAKTCSAIQSIIKAGTISGWVIPTACTSQPTTAPLPTTEVFLQDEPTYSYSTDVGRNLMIVAGAALVVVAGYGLWRMRK